MIAALNRPDFSDPKARMKHARDCKIQRKSSLSESALSRQNTNQSMGSVCSQASPRDENPKHQLVAFEKPGESETSLEKAITHAANAILAPASLHVQDGEVDRFDLTMHLSSMNLLSTKKYADACLQKIPDEKPQQASTPEKAVVDNIFLPYRGHSSIARDSDAFEVSRWYYRHQILRSASAITSLSCSMWGRLLDRAGSMLGPGKTHSGVAFVASFRFDETPSKIRIRDLEADQSTQSSNALAKIFQTEYSIAMLLRHNDTGKHLMISGSIPAPLQVLDRQTAQNMHQAMEDTFRLPNLEHVADMFQKKLFLFCADEFSSNDLCQWSMQATRPDGNSHWLRMATLCSIHKASSVQGRVFDLTGSAISAIINLSLSMVPAGSISKIQGFLSTILANKFQLRVGKPELTADAIQYRKDVFDTFLFQPEQELLDMWLRVPSKQRRRHSLKAKQKAILSHFFNGDLRSDEVIHWCKEGQYADVDQARNLFLKYVVPALIPGRCPLFPRNRWFGADETLDYVGLWSSIHNLFPSLIEALTGKNLPNGPGAYNINSIKDDDENDDGRIGWDFEPTIAAAAAQPSRNAADDVPDQHAPLELQVVQAEADHDSAPGPPEGQAEKPGFDWYEYQKKLKTSVFEWVAKAKNPSVQTQISLMRQFMDPILRILLHLLYVSSKRWTKDQLVKEAKGMARDFKILLEHEAHHAEALSLEVIGLLQQPPRCISLCDWQQDVAVLAFTMLSRLVCGTHQLLEWRCKKYPYALFAALRGHTDSKKIFETSPCLQDEVTQSLKDMFPTADLFASSNCNAFISFLARLAETDIGPIERQHAISRRIIQMRSFATTPVALEALSADWLLRRFVQNNVDVSSYRFVESDLDIKRFRDRTKRWKNMRSKVRKMKRKKGGGGAYRAFISAKMKGKKATRQSFQDLAEEYRQLSPGEKQYYSDIGAVATATHRTGNVKPFGPKRSQEPSSDLAALLASASNAELPVNPVNMSLKDAIERELSSDVQVQLFNPDERLKKQLNEIQAAQKSLKQRFEDSKISAVECFSHFLQGKSSLGTPPSLDQLPPLEDFCPGPEISQHSCFPQPSPLPWIEWSPPVDAMAKVRVSGKNDETI